MSQKRQATSELNHNNWDIDDPIDHEEMGKFKSASQDVLSKRVMRTAKRRSNLVTGDKTKRGVFSSFDGFNKPQPTSFDFLANLTNGGQSINGSANNAGNSSITPNLFNSNPLNSEVPATTQAKPFSFSMPSTDTSSKPFSFGGTSTNTSTPKAAPFSFGSAPTNIASTPFSFGTPTTNALKQQTAAPVFGIPSIATTTSSPSTLFGIPPANTSVAQPTPSVFGNSSLNTLTSQGISSVFGSAATSTPAPQTKPTVFGSPPISSPASQANVFGSPAINTSTTQTVPNVFGSPITSTSTTQAVPSIFGSPPPTSSTTQSNSSTIFGSPATSTNVQQPISNIFGSSSASAVTTSSAIFGIPSATTTTAQSTPIQFGVPTKPHSQPISFGIPSTISSTTQSIPIFGIPSTSSSNAKSIFTTTKVDTSSAESVFKIQPAQSSNAGFSIKTGMSKPAISVQQSKSNIFGVATNENRTSNFSSTTVTTTQSYRSQPISSIVSMDNTFGSKPLNTSPTAKEKVDKNKQIVYIMKLKNLNACFSEWIKRSLEEAPISILSPVFKDYDRYLKEIEDEYANAGNNSLDNKGFSARESFSLAKGADERSDNITTHNSTSLTFSTNNGPTRPSSVLGGQTSRAETFSFADKTSAPANTSTGLFAVNNNNPSTAMPFSTNFGANKPFSFSSSQVESKSVNDNAEENDDNEDEPPKVDFTPVTEENSVYDKKCKVFVKKGTDFIDTGVGTLFVKHIKENDKYQLIVRANTNLGTLILNLILGAGMPLQKMGKNNVMMVCIPTPDSKPPPSTILIRVKTSEEADELLEILKKYTQ